MKYEFDFEPEPFQKHSESNQYELLNANLEKEQTALPISNVPVPGRFYSIQANAGGFLTTVGRAYGLKEGAERLLRAQDINNHSLNRKFWRSPKNEFERKFFPVGIITFMPIFTCDTKAQIRIKNTVPRGNCYAVIWIPPRMPKKPEVPVRPKPLPDKPNPKPSLFEDCRISLEESKNPNIKACTGIVKSDVTSDLVKEVWLSARCRVELVVKRLRYLASLPETLRKEAWNSGSSQEKVWFGPYHNKNFLDIQSNFQRISDTLKSKRLRILCDPRKTRRCLIKKKCIYASSKPFIHVITLKEAWLYNIDENERVQTLIHEAAHIAGVVAGSEYRKYGPSCAKKLALQNCFKAKRNADNYGYFALRHVLAYKEAKLAGCPFNFFPRRSCD